MNPREEFLTILDQLNEAKAQYPKPEDREALFVEDIRRVYFEMFPKRRKFIGVHKFSKVHPEEYREILERHRKDIEVRYQETKKLETAFKEKLYDLAPKVEIRPSTERNLRASVFESTYSSQGLGSRDYARKRAELWSLEAEVHGLGFDVEEKHVDKICCYFEVWFYCSEEDIQILSYKEGVSMREIVKWCWGNGVNPRVYFPFLPHGFEKEEGLDFFGNEL